MQGEQRFNFILPRTAVIKTQLGAGGKTSLSKCHTTEGTNAQHRSMAVGLKTLQGKGCALAHPLSFNSLLPSPLVQWLSSFAAFENCSVQA